jgi:hypothetical protein
MHTFFKDIAHHMQNAEEDSTSNKMSDEQLVEFISGKFA